MPQFTSRGDSPAPPDLDLYWRGRFSTLPAGWYPDLLRERPIFQQILQDATGRTSGPLRESEVSQFTDAASKYGIWPAFVIDDQVKNHVIREDHPYLAAFEN